MYQDGQLVQCRQRFVYAIGTNSVAVIVPVTLPKQARFVALQAIGAGSNGAAGATGTAGNNRNGGNGGASAGMSSAIYPARALPSTFYIVTGIVNTPTFICVVPATPSINNQVILAANSAAGATAGASVSLNTYPWQVRALSFTSAQGINGGTGNTGAGANASHAGLLSAGGVGGGCALTVASNGGSVVMANASNFLQTGATSVLSQGGVAGAILEGSNGYDTLQNLVPYGSTIAPWYSVGGAGGASVNSGTGGAGGNGGVGAGGGGGGAGTTGGAGGLGGGGFGSVEWW